MLTIYVISLPYSKKKIIIHIPVKQKHHKHTHTHLKSIHHHHKPTIIKEEKIIKQEIHHPAIKIKEEVEHEHFHHHYKHDHPEVEHHVHIKDDESYEDFWNTLAKIYKTI